MPGRAPLSVSPAAPTVRIADLAADGAGQRVQVNVYEAGLYELERRDEPWPGARHWPGVGWVALTRVGPPDP